MYVHLCVCVNICVCTGENTCTCMWKTEDKIKCHSLVAILPLNLFVSLRQGFSSKPGAPLLDLLDYAGWPDREPHRSSYLYLITASFVGARDAMLVFLFASKHFCPATSHSYL